MKKCVFTVMVVLSSLFFFGCFSDDDTASIESRIEALESAINNQDVEAFRGCFLSTSNYYDTYDQAQFDDKFLVGSTYTTYNFGSVVVAGDLASCTSTKSTSGGTSYTNEFTMVKDGDEWYIEKWLEKLGAESILDEDYTIVWQVPVKK
jgi:hypothetical protein